MGDSEGLLSVLAPGTSWVGDLSRASNCSSAPESGGACSPFVFLTGGAVFCIEKGGYGDGRQTHMYTKGCVSVHSVFA